MLLSSGMSCALMRISYVVSSTWLLNLPRDICTSTGSLGQSLKAAHMCSTNEGLSCHIHMMSAPCKGIAHAARVAVQDQVIIAKGLG